MTLLKTKRLTLRRARLSDAPDLHKVYSDPAVMRYWSSSPHVDVNQTTEMLKRHIGASYPILTYFVLEHQDRAIGCAGVHEGDEIGYILGSAYWRQGLMSEALGILIPYFFDTLEFQQLTADADPRNAASVASLLAAGFRKTGEAKNTFCVNDEWSDSVYFALKRPEPTC